MLGQVGYVAFVNPQFYKETECQKILWLIELTQTRLDNDKKVYISFTIYFP